MSSSTRPEAAYLSTVDLHQQCLHLCSSWSSWLVPMGLALAASMVYRYLFLKEDK